MRIDFEDGPDELYFCFFHFVGCFLFVLHKMGSLARMNSDVSE